VHFCAEVLDRRDDVTTVRIWFGSSTATNTELVPDALAALRSLDLSSGRGIRFVGPASIPVAMALGHAAAHQYGYVACFDPKLQGYVVAISRDPTILPGQLLP